MLGPHKMAALLHHDRP